MCCWSGCCSVFKFSLVDQARHLVCVNVCLSTRAEGEVWASSNDWKAEKTLACTKLTLYLQHKNHSKETKQTVCDSEGGKKMEAVFPLVVASMWHKCKFKSWSKPNLSAFGYLHELKTHKTHSLCLLFLLLPIVTPNGLALFSCCLSPSGMWLVELTQL